jgi:hypothetical protein
MKFIIIIVNQNLGLYIIVHKNCYICLFAKSDSPYLLIFIYRNYSYKIRYLNEYHISNLTLNINISVKSV